MINVLAEIGNTQPEQCDTYVAKAHIRAEHKDLGGVG